MTEHDITKPDIRSLEIGPITVVYAPEHGCWVGLGGKLLRSETQAERYGVAMAHEYGKLERGRQ